jgi:HAD superfamily hydrolase (TIGR01509 family)
VIRGFLFDLDGTLVDSERETGEAMARAFARGQGITLAQYDKDFIIGRSWMAIYESLRSRYPQMTWTRDECITQTALLRDEVFAEIGVTVLPGARDVLRWTQGFPRALVTGSSRVEALQLLPLIGDMARFDAIFASEDVARSKPHPDGYQAAMQVLGLLPHECCIVEDSLNGIAAARAAGCLTVAVRAGNFGGWDQTGAHRVIDTLEAFTPVLVEELYAIYGPDLGSRR